METFIGGAELLRRWGRYLEARVACCFLSPSVLRIRPAAIIALIIISSGPCNPALLPNNCGYSTLS